MDDVLIIPHFNMYFIKHVYHIIQLLMEHELILKPLELRSKKGVQSCPRQLEELLAFFFACELNLG